MNISEFQKCSNCGACYNVCPRNAISVNSDGMFFVPTVNRALCIDCSKCVDICPANNSVNSNQPLAAFAGWNNDCNIVLGSSSGGAFWGIAQRVIANGGVVYAAVFSDRCHSVIFASSDERSLTEMMKSKYVESSVGYSFREIRHMLEQHREVLFCGTPCQVAGLRNFLNKEYDNLITCDFACGGLPSHKIFEDYLHELEVKHHSSVKKVDFRPKIFGWKRYAIRVLFDNGKEYIRLGTEDPFLGSFLYGKYTVRDYCLSCKFPEAHLSDITIADFWLHEKLSSLKNNSGISLILCNSQKGIEAIQSMKAGYTMVEMDVDQASYNNHISYSRDRIEKHDQFIQYVSQHGLDAAYRKFLPSSLKDRLKNIIIRTWFRDKDFSQ